MEWLKQNWLGLLGTAVSIGSALFSLIQANKAKKVKEDIIKKYANYNDSELRSKIDSVLRQLNTFRGRKNFDETNKIGKNEYSVVTELLIAIRGQKIFDEPEIQKYVTDSEQITQTNDFDTESIQTLICNLADIQRFIDKSIRGE